LALHANTTGSNNTAMGRAALGSNTTGPGNTAMGVEALLENTTGFQNTAVGGSALEDNTTGDQNTATGSFALNNNITGNDNTAVGRSALESNTAGNANTAIGRLAGFNITGDFNICIGAVTGVAGVDHTTWIGNVYDSVATARQVYVNSDGKIGTLASSRRYKEEIKDMSNASEALYALNPVTFRYKKQIDPAQALSFGLIAEQVAEINPALITRDKAGKAETVRYEAINAMLLNEFLKEHRKNEEQQSKIDRQEAKIARQQEQIEALTAGLQKVSAQIELTKPAPQTVLND